jgi:hypothetical protein
MTILQESLERIARSGGGFDVIGYAPPGLHGETCLAIDGEDIDLFQLGLALGAEGHGIYALPPATPRRATVPHGAIYYWPDIKYEEMTDEAKPPMRRRYFDCMADAPRIAVIESDDASLANFQIQAANEALARISNVRIDDNEIQESDLPDDFAAWKVYTGIGYMSGDKQYEVLIMSRNGD